MDALRLRPSSPEENFDLKDGQPSTLRGMGKMRSNRKVSVEDGSDSETWTSRIPKPKPKMPSLGQSGAGRKPRSEREMWSGTTFDVEYESESKGAGRALGSLHGQEENILDNTLGYSSEDNWGEFRAVGYQRLDHYESDSPQSDRPKSKRFKARLQMAPIGRPSKTDRNEPFPLDALRQRFDHRKINAARFEQYPPFRVGKYATASNGFDQDFPGSIAHLLSDDGRDDYYLMPKDQESGPPPAIKYGDGFPKNPSRIREPQLLMEPVLSAVAMRPPRSFRPEQVNGHRDLYRHQENMYAIWIASMERIHKYDLDLRFDIEARRLGLQNGNRGPGDQHSRIAKGTTRDAPGCKPLTTLGSRNPIDYVEVDSEDDVEDYAMRKPPDYRNSRRPSPMPNPGTSQGTNLGPSRIRRPESTTLRPSLISKGRFLNEIPRRHRGVVSFENFGESRPESQTPRTLAHTEETGEIPLPLTTPEEDLQIVKGNTLPLDGENSLRSPDLPIPRCTSEQNGRDQDADPVPELPAFSTGSQALCCPKGQVNTQDTIKAILERFCAAQGQAWISPIPGNCPTGSSNNPSTPTRDSTESGKGESKPGIQGPKTDRQPQKRRRVGGGDSGASSDDSGEESPGPGGHRGGSGNGRSKKDQPKDLQLACPYRKRDPLKYKLGTHRTCACSHFPNMARVKEHIYRAHKLIVCIRCQQEFPNQKVYEAHQRADVACERRDEVPHEGITAEQEKRLKSRKEAHQNKDAAEQWKSAYRILFPGEEPPSPYFEEFVDGHAYHAFLGGELPHRLEQAVRQMLQESQQPMALPLHLVLNNIKRIASEVLDTTFRSLHSGSALSLDTESSSSSSPLSTPLSSNCLADDRGISSPGTTPSTAYPGGGHGPIFGLDPLPAETMEQDLSSDELNFSLLGSNMLPLNTTGSSYFCCCETACNGQCISNWDYTSWGPGPGGTAHS